MDPSRAFWTETVTVQWAATRSVARRRKPQGKGGIAWCNVREIGARLTGWALFRACQRAGRRGRICLTPNPTRTQPNRRKETR